MNVEVTNLDIVRLRSCLWREAMHHREVANKYKKEGYPGIASSERAEEIGLMKLREKFPLKFTSNKQEVAK